MRDAAHDEFVADGADEEGDGHGCCFGVVGLDGVVDVAAQEVVDGDVPLAGKFEPAITEFKLEYFSHFLFKHDRTGQESGMHTNRRNSTNPNKTDGQRNG